MRAGPAENALQPTLHRGRMGTAGSPPPRRRTGKEEDAAATTGMGRGDRDCSHGDAGDSLLVEERDGPRRGRNHPLRSTTDDSRHRGRRLRQPACTHDGHPSGTIPREATRSCPLRPTGRLHTGTARLSPHDRGHHPPRDGLPNQVERRHTGVDERRQPPALPVTFHGNHARSASGRRSLLPRGERQVRMA